MEVRAIGLFLALSVAAASAAQNQPATGQQPIGKPATGTATKPAAGSIDSQVLEMRRQMTEGKQFRSHVRVTIRLKNGNRLNGIVKDGVLIERIDGIRFVAAEANDPGAGIRLYYWNGKGNFVFLSFEDIQDYRINARITPTELALIEREEREREEARKRKLAEEQGGAPTGPVDPNQPPVPPQPPQPAPLTEPAHSGAPTPAPMPGQGEPQQGGVTGELQAMYGLLQEFPPAAGWSQQRKDEIARRFTTTGAKPSAQEQRFVDKFADWQRACALFGQQPATPQNGANDTESTDSGNGRSRRSRK